MLMPGKLSFEREGLNSQCFNTQQLKQKQFSQQISVLETLNFFPQKPNQPSKTTKSLSIKHKVKETKGSQSTPKYKEQWVDS